MTLVIIMSRGDRVNTGSTVYCVCTMQGLRVDTRSEVNLNHMGRERTIQAAVGAVLVRLAGWRSRRCMNLSKFICMLYICRSNLTIPACVYVLYDACNLNYNSFNFSSLLAFN